MSEIWKPIKGYGDFYEVSNLGRIRSTDHIGNTGGRKPGRQLLYKGKILKQHINNNGYKVIIIHNHTGKKNLLVHRYVAMAFVAGYFEGAQVNHKDENKQNNRWDNLEWVSRVENCNYGTRNKRCNDWGEQNLWIPVVQYNLEGQVVASYKSVSAASRALHVAYSRIRFVLDTQCTVKGFRFKRKTTLPL